MRITTARVAGLPLALFTPLMAFAQPAPRQPAPRPPARPRAAATQPAPRSPNIPQEAEGRAALAEKFSQQAQTLLRAAGNPPAAAVLREAAALFDAAGRLNPAEPRFPRLRAEACASAGDPEGELAAWSTYRRAVPDDRVAQARSIELYASRLETADAKIAYLKDLLAKPSLAPELKAHIAAMAVPFLEQRSHSEAEAMIHQARRFYPLNEVVWLEYNLLPKDAPIPQRLAILLDQLKANPAQPGPLYETAHLLSLAGLHTEATLFYQHTVDVLRGQMLGMSLQVGIDYAVNLYRTGQVGLARSVVATFIQPQMYPDSPEVWFLQLTMQRPSVSPDQLRLARNAVDKGLNHVAAQLSSASPKTMPATVPADTRPAASAAPRGAADPGALAALAKELNAPELTAGLIGALSDRAWLEIYFANDPARAKPYVDALKALLPADDVTVARLGGWLEMQGANAGAAREKLAAAAGRDALAQLGLYQIEAKAGNSAKAAEIAGKLLAEPATGLLGAILHQAMYGKGHAPATQPVTSQAKALLDAFPVEWLSAADLQKAGAAAPAARFYSLRAEPLKVAHHVGEPMLARITLTNVGKYDLSIGAGPAGLVQPDLWFNAQLRGMTQQAYPGIAFDRLMGRTLLHPRESMSQVVRLDQGDLGAILRTVPVGALMVDGSVLLNPLPAEDGVHLAPGGQYVPFSKSFSRLSEPLSSDVARTKLLAAMQTHSPAERIMDLDLLAAYVQNSAKAPADSPDAAQAEKYRYAIGQERTHASPSVSTWAGALIVELMDGPVRQTVVQEMAAAPAWESRLFALAESRLLAAEPRKALASRLAASDPDPTVKAFAAAALEAPDLPASTQPATRPAPPATRAALPATRPALPASRP